MQHASYYWRMIVTAVKSPLFLLMLGSATFYLPGLGLSVIINDPPNTLREIFVGVATVSMCGILGVAVTLWAWEGAGKITVLRGKGGFL